MNYTVFLVKKIPCFLTIHMMNIYFIQDCSDANFLLSLLLIRIDITLKYYLYTIVKMRINIFRMFQITLLVRYGSDELCVMGNTSQLIPIISKRSLLHLGKL